MKSIVLTGGGTIGHTAPHFAIIPHLKFDKIYYIGSSGIEKDYVKSHNIPYYEINPTKFNRSFTFKNLQIPFKFIKSVKESEKILKELNPSVVFSKGGFVGLPVTIASKRLKIPVIIHESDLSIGLANKIASKFSDFTLTTFDKTAKNIKNGKYVGAIIRNELTKQNKNSAYNYYGIKPKKPVLLIIGGSSGAKIINETVLKCLNYLTERFFVFHVVGKGNLSGVKAPNYFETEFTDLSYIYAISDIAVSRAGSNTAFELAHLKIPTLFIPLSKGSSRGDQIENANYFKSLKICDVLYQEDLTPTILKNRIIKLLENKERYLKYLKELDLKIANSEIANILNNY
ncbi:MAG: UDP-N-acetylglucosamine--N-acetylmuramyl-(pentapeptide) pyrophosphoryl-undecaprenol N-acetylglucosamine transferase [Clostridia bacterium]|nr:UDP-N-acetylglucosamine--N-acetylmuramyl-(pentapeptide) pyrophosphoryl-undecaprenol N-acetylglucosamine transferase [Clostridia bacterium]